MERGFGTFGIGTTLPARSRVLERLGQRSDRPNVSSLSQDSKTRPNFFAKASKPALSVHYTISEDRCGTEEEIKGKILANLQPKCEGPIDELSEFIVALGGQVTDEVVELLRSNRGVINREDEDGDTPIHTAVRTGKLEILQHLIALGATVYHRNDAARTPLFLAARLGMYSQASLLRQAGAQLHNEELEEARFLAKRDPEIWRVAGLETAPVIQQPTSYWSVPEQLKFPQLIAYFGSDFTATADFMKTKTATMIKNYYNHQISRGELNLRHVAAAADRRRAAGEPLRRPPSPIASGKRRFEADASPSLSNLSSRVPRREQRGNDDLSGT